MLQLLFIADQVSCLSFKNSLNSSHTFNKKLPVLTGSPFVFWLAYSEMINDVRAIMFPFSSTAST